MAVRPSGVQHCIRGDCIVYCTLHCTRTFAGCSGALQSITVLSYYNMWITGSNAASTTAWLLCTLKAISRVWSLDRVEEYRTLFISRLVYFVTYVH